VSGWLGDHWRWIGTGGVIVAAVWLWAGLKLAADADERAGRRDAP
jgi:hypothetical protein